MLKGLIILALSFQYYFNGITALDLQLGGANDVCDIDGDSTADDACSMTKAFGGSQIIPQVMPSFSPVGALYVQYNNVVVGGAQQLSPSRVSNQPEISLTVPQENLLNLQLDLTKQLFTGLAIDYEPDNGLQKLMWLQTDLIAQGSDGLLSSRRKPTVPYISPRPAQGTGTHVYLFLLYEQTSKGLLGLFSQQVTLNSATINAFKLQDFLKANQLDNNSLVAGSYFKSTYDGLPINAPSISASTPQIQTSPVQVDTVNRQSSSAASSSINTSNTQTGNSAATVAQVSSAATNGTSSDANQSTQPQTNATARPNLCDLDNDAAQDGCDMTSAFGGSSITPNVVPDFEPIGALYVQYGNVILGGAQQMSSSRVRLQPSLKFSSGLETDNSTLNQRFLLILIDTVDKTDSKVSVSWIQSDIQIVEEDLVMTSTKPICPYLSPVPSDQIARERNYIFLLYQQSTSPFQLSNQYSGMDFASNHPQATIDLESFATQNSLGTPIAGSFFKTSLPHSLRRRTNSKFQRLSHN